MIEKNKFGLAAVVATTLLAATPGYALRSIADGRCGAWGDNLGQPEAKVRVDFSLACEQNAKTRSEVRRNFTEGMHRVGSDGVTAGYPSYGRFDAAKDDWVNDTDGKGTKWFAPPSSPGKACTDIPSGYEIAYFCASGCYAPEQGVLFLGGEQAVAKAKADGLTAISILDEGSSLEAPKLKEGKVAHYLSDVKAGPQPILEIAMKSGGKLRVTPNHPLIDGEGRMRKASDLAVGESLVKADGAKDAIASIESKILDGKVYNVAIDAKDPRNHVVVAQGYLNGALFYQNEGVKELNRELLRTSVAKHFIRN